MLRLDVISFTDETFIGMNEFSNNEFTKHEMGQIIDDEKRNKIYKTIERRLGFKNESL